MVGTVRNYACAPLYGGMGFFPIEICLFLVRGESVASDLYLSMEMAFRFAVRIAGEMLRSDRDDEAVPVEKICLDAFAGISVSRFDAERRKRRR